MDDDTPAAPRERQEPTRTPDVDRAAKAAEFRSNTDAINNAVPGFRAAQSIVNAAQGLARSAFPDDPERQKGYVAAVKENAASTLERGDDIKPYRADRSEVDRAREAVREDRGREVHRQR